MRVPLRRGIRTKRRPCRAKFAAPPNDAAHPGAQRRRSPAIHLAAEPDLGVRRRHGRVAGQGDRGRGVARGVLPIAQHDHCRAQGDDAARVRLRRRRAEVLPSLDPPARPLPLPVLR